MSGRYNLFRLSDLGGLGKSRNIHFGHRQTFPQQNQEASSQGSNDARVPQNVLVCQFSDLSAIRRRKLGYS